MKVMLVLIDRTNTQDGRCDSGTERLMRDTRLTRASITRARAGLRAKKLIRYWLRGKNSAAYAIDWHHLNSLYRRHFLPPPNPDGALYKKLAAIERRFKADRELSDSDRELLDATCDEHYGDGLGGMAYRLLTEGPRGRDD